jgi:hypothetical protein
MAVLSRWLGALALVGLAAPARADGTCHVVNVDFTPISNLQIVAWLEDTAGHYVDTIYITQATGTYGIGNRPGRFDFNSGAVMYPSWPYGRRITTFPVWAHRHGLTFPEVDFQDGQDSDLSHSFEQSSTEMHFCRPTADDEASWDTGTCASTVYTDKGVFSTTQTSLYPPRQDIVAGAKDSASVDMYNALNPFDAVSQATPVGNTPAEISWPIPTDLPLGDYVLFIEASREFDMNATYNPTSYPAPDDIPYKTYGEPYRGQPSVVYKIPFTIQAMSSTTADTMDYVGYGDPDGIDGMLRAPDGTITTGAERFQVISDNGLHRFRLTALYQDDSIPPADVMAAQTTSVDESSAAISFVAPGDDGTIGKVSGYEIRYRAGSEITDDNFADARSVAVKNVPPGDPGSLQSFLLDKLLPETNYSVGIRAYDKCHNTSTLTVVDFRTADRVAGAVDACFIATAAYGSIMASDVDMLRHFRDAALKSSVLGELAVETYYTFGPAVAGVVGESDLLRETARAALAPVVTRVRSMKY